MNKIVYGILALFIIGILATGAMAYGGDFEFEKDFEGKHMHRFNGEMPEDRSAFRAEMYEKHEAVRTAVEAGDYSLVPEDAPITEEQFEHMLERHANGDFEKPMRGPRGRFGGECPFQE